MYNYKNKIILNIIRLNLKILPYFSMAHHAFFPFFWKSCKYRQIDKKDKMLIALYHVL